MSKKELLSILWIFATLNYIFCDVFTLFHAPDLNQFLTGYAGGMQLTQVFLLSFAVIMELGMIMILLSRLLNYPWNRRLNIIVGLMLTIIQTSTLFSGDSTLHYWFFSFVEIATTATITWVAFQWKHDQA